MSAVLLIKEGDGPRDPIRLVSPKLTLGRAPYADVGFESTYLSRQHAEITREDDGFYIRDLGSSNGTSINEERLSSESRLLKAGDEIGLADGQVVLRFVASEDTTRLPPSTPAPADAADKALVLDAQQRTVAVYGKAVQGNLSRKEFDVLAMLCERAGRPVSRQDISVEGWPDRRGDVSEGEINQLIRRIRRKIEPDPRQPCFLLTDPGYGYRLDPYGPGSP